MNNYIKLGLLLFFCFQVHQFYAVELVNQDYQTFVALASKLSLNISQYNSSNICYNFGLFCFPYTQQYWIINFDHEGNGSYSLTHQDVHFPYMMRLRFSKMILQENFMTELYYKLPNVTEFGCTSCNLTSIPTGTYITNSFILNENNFTGNHYFSEIPQNITSFQAYSSKADSSLNWLNNLNSERPISTMIISSKSFPDLTKIKITDLTLYLTPNFEKELINFNKLPNSIKTVFIRGDYQNIQNLTLPSSIVNIVSASTSKSWTFQSEFIRWVVSEPLTFTALNGVSSIKISSGGLSTINGGFPISNSKGSNLDTIEIISSTGSLSSIDFNVIRKIRGNNLSGNNIVGELPSEMTFENSDAWSWEIEPSTNASRRFNVYGLNIQRNKFFGSIPKWTCNVYGTYSSNKFTGELPSCYSCFLRDGSVRGLINGNNFTNYQDSWKVDQYPICTTIKINQAYFQGSNPYKNPGGTDFHIVGEDLGVHSVIVGMIEGFGNLTFVPLINNQWYYAPITKDAQAAISKNNRVKVVFVYADLVIDMNVKGLLELPFNSSVIQTSWNFEKRGAGTSSTTTGGVDGTSSTTTDGVPNNTSSLFYSQTLIFICCFILYFII